MKRTTLNLFRNGELQEQLQPEEVGNIKQGPAGYMLAVETTKGILHYCNEVTFQTHSDEPERTENIPFDTTGLQWHPMSEPMLPWHTCLLVHEKSYCLVRRDDDGRMWEITHNFEVKEGNPFHLVKWIDLNDIAKR